MDLNKLQTQSSQEPETNMWYLENKDDTLFIGTMKKNNTNNFYKKMDKKNINEQTWLFWNNFEFYKRMLKWCEEWW